MRSESVSSVRLQPDPPTTASELLAILSARQLKDGQVVFAGVGIPLLAATLAQRLRCPGLTILFEGGVIGAFIEPGRLPPSTNDQRCTARANMVLGSAEVLLLLQRGYVDVGFMGGAQIDQYGNLNSSFIGDPARPKTRLPGTGGGNDISSLTAMIVAMKHEIPAMLGRGGGASTSTSSPARAGCAGAPHDARAVSAQAACSAS